MNSSLYIGKVWHYRETPVVNRFTYRAFYASLDVDELPSLRLPLLAYNRPGLYEVRDADHFDSSRPIPDAAREVLRRAGVDASSMRVEMLAYPKFLGYIFNPISLFICRDGSPQPPAILAEVHNRSRGRHVYPMRFQTRDGDGTLRYGFDKEFYVSPFIGMDARYEFVFRESGDRLTAILELSREGKRFFEAGLSVRRRPLTTRNLLRLALTHPFTPQKTTALIYWQAIKLKLRGVHHYRNPHTTSVRPEPVEGSNGR